MILKRRLITIKNLDYIKYPTTIKILIEELKRATDDYLSRKITEKDFRIIIQELAKNSGIMLFNGDHNFNPTVVQRIGVKRLNLIKKMLEGYQYTF